ncbi:hypothetical protein ACFL27_28895 [candidate division CSSED10-310 bacterium]|uniref:Uncharacterized protein n=1 Tax=candidate division CSSED10-310 bacterium TaxID=2855610 RepID=A0ABV6Z780_UNCC1
MLDQISFDQFIAGAIAIMIVMMLMPIWWHHHTNKNWQKFARKFGLQMTKPRMMTRPEINGTYRSQRIHIYTEAPERKSVRTVIKVYANNPVNLGLSVAKEGFLSNLILGIQGMPENIQLGDPHYDALFFIHGNDEHAVKSFLTPELRQSFEQLLKAESQVRLEDSGVTAELSGWVHSVKRLSRTLEGMVSVCELADRSSRALR